MKTAYKLGRSLFTEAMFVTTGFVVFVAFMFFLGLDLNPNLSYLIMGLLITILSITYLIMGKSK